MAWYGPNQCDDQCCYPPTPCEPPRVTCKRYATGGTFGQGYLTYTISLADTAWVSESCDAYGGAIGTDYPITLSGGAATGTFSDVKENCSYNVTAVNECGKRFCIDECTPPFCSLKVYRRIKEGTLSEYDAVIVEWEYNWKATPHSPFAIDEIISATLNGTDVLDLPTHGSGVLIYTDPDDLPDDFTLTVENDCGLVSECVYTVPCCWKVKQLRVSFSMSNASATCTRTDLGTINGVLYHSVTDSFSTTGLAVINGTHLFDTWPFTCDLKPELRTLGTFTVRHEGTIDATTLGVRQVNEFVYEWEVTIKSDGLALFFSVLSGEVYYYRERDGVVLVDGQRCACSIFLNGVPPCSPSCINAVNGIPAFLASFSSTFGFNYLATCGSVEFSGFVITHRHPLMGLIKLGGTAGTCDPDFPLTNTDAVVPVTTITNAVTTEFL